MASRKNLTKAIWPHLFREIVLGKIKQADIASATGVTQSSVSQYLAGTRTPGAWELYRISKYLGVSMEYLLTGESGTKAALHPPGASKPELLFLAEEAKRAVATLEERIKKI